MVAMLSGPARASVGAVRDYLLGVTLLNGKAELLTFGGQVMRERGRAMTFNALMAGAWGTLGLLTEVSLKGLLPVAPGEATLLFEGINQADALRKLHAWGGKPLPLNASCRGRLMMKQDKFSIVAKIISSISWRKYLSQT